jgi:hypothetical protein
MPVAGRATQSHGAPRTFWNPTLLPLYNQCVLPVDVGPPKGPCLRQSSFGHRHALNITPAEHHSRAQHQRSIGQLFTDRSAMAESCNADAKRRKLNEGAKGTKGARQKSKLKDGEQLRSYKLRLRLTPSQETVLKRWFATGRWGYNTLLAHMRETNTTRQLPSK